MGIYNIWQNSRMLRLGMALALGLILLISLLRVIGTARAPDVASAQGLTFRYVAPAPIGNDGGNDCTSSSIPCATIQHSVDVAISDDEIRAATGTYTDVQARAGITQVVHISKTVTIRGGYSTAFTEPPDPVANPTELDARGQGRVLYITGDISPTIEGLRITGGYAIGLGGDPSGMGAGGGVYVITATLKMSNNQIFSNTAIFGGGLYSYKSANTMLINNTISNNTGETHAGGLYFRNSPGVRLIGNTISNNEAPPGVGLYGGARFDHSDNATLIDNIIKDNHAADKCGGACFDTSDNALLIGNTVISNSAGTSGFGSNAAGGGLRFVSSDGANLISNIVTNNITLGDGGGLYLERSVITMTNNVIADNQITITGNFTGSGSGLYIAGSSPRLLHTTIARNSGGDGSGIFIAATLGSPSAATLTNTILVSHTVAIAVSTGNTATLNGVLWYGNSSNTSGVGTIIITDGYTGAPAFAADGYHLTFSSEAIDKGVDAGVTVDINGYPRPCGLAPDVGADEINCLFLPIILKTSD